MLGGGGGESEKQEGGVSIFKFIQYRVGGAEESGGREGRREGRVEDKRREGRKKEGRRKEGRRKGASFSTSCGCRERKLKSLYPSYK